MQVKCKYCDSYLSDADERCPSCGATNDLLIRTANGAPKTIEELKSWYVAHNLPDENITRFFVGKNITEPRAFGIYKDDATGNFIVYKNKNTGERAVRYEGKDEAYAVNELYQKLKIEIQNQKMNQPSNKPVRIDVPVESTSKYPTQHLFQTTAETYRGKKSFGDRLIVIIFFIVVFMFIAIMKMASLGLYSGFNEGYYAKDNSYYYYDNANWYIVTDVNNNKWKLLNDEPFKKTKSKKYYESSENTSTDNIPDIIDFKTSGFYFDGCDEGYYTTDNKTIYYYTGDKWYYTTSNNTTWHRISIEEYDELLNDSIRNSCVIYLKEIDSSWNIRDFRDTVYYVPKEGYYHYNNGYYYYLRAKGWYCYTSSWYKCTGPTGSYYNYYNNSYYSDNDYYTDFSDTDYYKDYYSSSRSSSSSSSSKYDSYSSDDWDSSSSWSSSDSWDSSSTDWSSDW